jgi:hypothetical protein
MRQTLSRWHPWPERPGRRHLSTLWNDHSIWKNAVSHFDPDTAEQAISFAGRERLYVFCNDPMDWTEFLWSDDLLLGSDVYVQKTGKVVALRVQSGRHSGFFIPARSWGFPVANFEMIETIDRIYHLFNLEGITPSSLGEKVVRSTLPERIAIFRPAYHLRSVLLESGGGIIYNQEDARFFPEAWKYDLHKAFMSFADSVPDILFPPKFHICPAESWLYDYDTPGYWEVTMVAHGNGLHPILLGTGGNRHMPVEGEQFHKWLWRDEIMACIEKGYTLLYIHKGYRWPDTTDFLKPWTDLMWSKFQQAESKEEERIIKSMIVGFFGRCLREPTNHFLVPRGQERKGDIPVKPTWLEHQDNWQDIDCKRFFTDWYLREEYFEESTSLTPIGSWVIMKCRLAMFKLAQAEQERGNRLIDIYIDSATFEKRVLHLPLGPAPGEYNEDHLTNVWSVKNALVPNEIKKMRAPGYKENSKERKALWQNYHQPKDC